MTKLLLAVLMFSASIPAFAQNDRDGRRGQDRFRDRDQKACTCVELERRINGLQRVLNRAQLYGNEERRIRQDVNQARRHYQNVDFRLDRQGEQNRKCSLGNMAADQSWRQWQPWLARRGWDQAVYCRDRRP